MRKAALSLIITAIVMTVVSTAAAEIPWQTNLRAAHAQAQAEGKLLLLHFYSDNCTWCERLEAGSFQAPQVGQTVVKDFIPVKVHANKNPQLTEMFKVTKFPTDVIVTTKGKTLSHQVSPQQPDRYVAMLTAAIPANTLPSNFAAQPPAPPAPKPQIQADTVAAVPDAEPTLPGYAQSPAPQIGLQAEIEPPVPAEPTATSLASTPTGGPTGFELPTGVKGQLASSQSENLTLQMPTQETLPAAEPTATQALTPATETNIAAAKAAPQPELAMQGFCAVTVINENRWADGSPQYGVIHLGKLYLFVSEEAMQTFLADPVPYTPVLNEIDVVRFFEEKMIVPGKREWGVKDPIYNRMFFFADEAARDHFENTYERYTDAAIKVMEQAVKDANPGT